MAPIHLFSTVPVLLTALFAALKISKVVTWSWWIITAPIWTVLLAILAGLVALYLYLPVLMKDEEMEGEDAQEIVTIDQKDNGVDHCNECGCPHLMTAEVARV